MARLIRAFDWSSTPLGPIGSWSVSLRAATGFLLLSPVPIVMLWGDDGIMIYNDAYAVFAGQRHPALLGSKVREGWPEVADFNDHVMKVGLAGGTLAYKDQELTLTRRGEPEPVWMNLDYSPVLGDDGEPAGVVAIVVETTDRVLSDRRLKAERQQLSQLFEQAPSFMALLEGPSHQIVLANASYYRLVGDHSALGKTVAEVMPNATDQGYIDLLDSVYQSGRVYTARGASFQIQLEPDQPPLLRYLDFVYQPIVDSTGTVTGIFVEGSDVTEKTLVEAALRELNETLEERVEERTRALQDSMDFARLALSAVGGVGVWTYDVASDRFFCDAAISELYELDPAAGATGILREDFLKNVHPADRPSLGRTMAGGLAQSGDLELEYRLVHADGSIRWVLSRGHTYFEGGKPVRRTGVGIDMTKQRLLEEQFRQAQKMEAVGQLTGGIAHDFNNLLTGITGSLQLLQARVAQGRIGEIDRYVNAALGASRRAASLTHRLLAFSRRQTLDPRPTDVNRLVAGMEELIRRTIGPEITLETVGAGGLWTTLVDPSQLENALLNLCINARDAMPGGGRLTIETGNRWLDRAAAKERDLDPGQYVSLCVSDTGTGMTPDIVARAFDPFFTTKPIGQGTGLGLSMIYGFARQSGGQVRIYSEPGDGTMVCIYLPRHLGASDQPETGIDLTEAPRAQSHETVLVIDDEPTIRMLVGETLQELGYRVIEALDGPSGLRELDGAGRIDLLITDVGLPGGMNGRQVADAARVRRPKLKVLFITGYAENAVISHGHLDAGMHVLTKPFPMETLASRVQEILTA